MTDDLPFSEVVIHRRSVKRLSLRVRDNGVVEMVGPRRVPDAEFERFYLTKQRWVTKQRQSFLLAQASKPTLGQQQMLLHGNIIESQKTGNSASEKTDAYRIYAKQYLHQRLTKLSSETGLMFSRITVRAQRTRWGSCSNKKSISLNWRLVQMPEFVSDYVMIHELCHTEHMNHSQAFWQLVSQHCPRTDEARLWLKANGSQLPD